jgi:uroporphyrinogen decarboxylase
MNEVSQRLLALFRGERIDKPPYYEPWFAMRQMLDDRYGGSYIAMAQDLGHAAVPIGSLNTDVMFLKDVERTDAGAYYGGGELRDPQQLLDRPEPDYHAQIEPLLAARRAAHDAGLATWLVIGWCFDRIAASMGLEHLAMTCYDDPDFLRDCMAWVEQRNRRAIEIILPRVRPDFVLYNGDCAYKTGTMIDPAMLRDLCFDESKLTVDLVRDMDIPFALHTDGKLDDVIPILLDLGICAVHGCEAQANELAYLVDRFGDDIVLCGNMDVVFLAGATPDQVRAATMEMLEIGSRKGRFVAGCNTSPQDYIPVENYVAMLRTVERWGV